MSSINSYQKKLLGFIKCDSDFDIVHNNTTRKIAIYKLKQNIPKEEINFDGQINDIILGGGSGEAPAFRISYPNAFNFFTQDSFDDFDNYDQLFKTFWSPTQSFKLCNGYLKSGWNPETNIEFWLAEEMIKLLGLHIPEYSNFATQKSSLTLIYAQENNEFGK